MRENRQPAGNPTVNRKKRAISEAGRAALGGNRRREGATVVCRKGFGNHLNGQHGRQGRQRWQRRTEIMRRQTELAGVGRQAILVARRMLDRVRPHRQLGEEEHDDEKEMAQHQISVSVQQYVGMAGLNRPGAASP